MQSSAAQLKAWKCVCYHRTRSVAPWRGTFPYSELPEIAHLSLSKKKPASMCGM